MPMIQLCTAQVTEDPGARAAAAAELAGDLDHHAERHLVAAVARGLEELVEAGGGERLVRLDGDAAVAIGLERALAERRHHRPGAFEDLLARGRLHADPRLP